jgi:hypothetical protein
MLICSDCYQGHHSLGRGYCSHKPRILLDSTYGTGGRSSGLACNCRCEARPYKPNGKEMPCG